MKVSIVLLVALLAPSAFAAGPKAGVCEALDLALRAKYSGEYSKFADKKKYWDGRQVELIALSHAIDEDYNRFALPVLHSPAGRELVRMARMADENSRPAGRALIELIGSRRTRFPFVQGEEAQINFRILDAQNIDKFRLESCAHKVGRSGQVICNSLTIGELMPMTEVDSYSHIIANQVDPSLALLYPRAMVSELTKAGCASRVPAKAEQQSQAKAKPASPSVGNRRAPKAEARHRAR